MIMSKIESMKNRTLNDFSNMLKKSSMFALAFGLGSGVWSIKHNFFARCSAVAECVKGDEGEMGEWLKPPVC